MASRRLLRVKPQITATGLPKTDPFVLPVIASDLHDKAGRTFDLKGGGLLRALPTFFVTPTLRR